MCAKAGRVQADSTIIRCKQMHLIWCDENNSPLQRPNERCVDASYISFAETIARKDDAYVSTYRPCYTKTRFCYVRPAPKWLTALFEMSVRQGRELLGS